MALRLLVPYPVGGMISRFPSKVCCDAQFLVEQAKFEELIVAYLHRRAYS